MRIANRPAPSSSFAPRLSWTLISWRTVVASMLLLMAVIKVQGTGTRGHTLIANYTFEDNSLFVHDFAGDNNMSYGWFLEPPTIVANDAAAGTYAGGLGGSGWFTPPSSLGPLFEKSFSVSLWLKTATVFESDTADQYSSAGIVSDLGSDYDQSAAPMLQSGHKLGFYTGGDVPNVLHSSADITTGQYVHLVVTRDQQTGQKCIYVNGVLDATIFASTNVLESSSNGDLTIGYNNGNVFSGQVDEIQFYAGVLSSSDVALLHDHPGTNVADVLQLDFPAARYNFENTNNAGVDSSPHHNDSFCRGIGPTNDVASTNVIVGNYARQFFGQSFICFAASDFPALSNALTGDFSVTAWVNTTNSINSDSDDAIYGMPVFYAYSEPTNGTIPLTITGSKAAFSIYNTNNSNTTIHSLTSVNDGRYHFIAVTRMQANGLMSLYVDGVLEATAVGNTSPIRTDGTLFIGGGAFNYRGLLDDVRIYGGTLSPEDVATLAANGASTFASVLGTTNFLWSTSGDSPWTIETTNTYNGAAAALQSGSISDSQTSTLSATIRGPGTLNFVWANPTVDNLDLEFDIDGNFEDDIGGFTDWTQAGLYHITPGQHTISWTAFANGDGDTNEAVFLGQVTFVPSYLAAHFDFENTNVLFPLDVSTNGNDMFYGFGFNGGGTAKGSDAAVGNASLSFLRNPSTAFSGGMVGWNPTPPGLLSTLAGSFTVSLWIKTTNHDGTAGDIASDGAPVVIADIPGDNRDVTPVALTGGAVAFGTGGTSGDDTLTSAKFVNDNLWHHVVVTRDQTTGQKRIFIDGVEDTASPGTGVPGLLNDPQSLSIGTRLDASFSNVSQSPIYSGFDGAIDDLQIYTRPLTGAEVTFLYTHPGLEVMSDTVGPVPIDAEIRLEFHGNAQNYSVFPVITAMNPPPMVDAQVISPHGAIRGGFSGASSSVYTSLNDVLQECNGTNWTLIIDGASPNARTLRFSVSVTGLDANTLPAFTVYAPTDGSVNVATNPLFTWSGLANFAGLNVVAATPVLQNFSAFLDPTVTNWSSPKLNYGTNQFFVNYSNSLPTVTFSIPVDIVTGQSLSNWTASAVVYSSAGSTFVVGAPGPLPVHLGSFQRSGTNIQFSFATLAGRPHILQTSTNLGAGPWLEVTNFVGDGSTQQFTIPNTNRSRFFRVVTQ